MEALEEQFHRAMIGVYERAWDECGHRATRFLQLVTDLDGVEAARRLLRPGPPSYGFEKLWELGHLDITMEALVVDPKWQTLFTEEEIAIARQRLVDCDYIPEGREQGQKQD